MSKLTSNYVKMRRGTEKMNMLKIEKHNIYANSYKLNMKQLDEAKCYFNKRLFKEKRPISLTVKTREQIPYKILFITS